MKPLLIVEFILLFSPSLSAQKQFTPPPLDSTTQLITYQDIVSIKTAPSREILFTNLSHWFDTAFRYSNSRIQINNPTNGEIVAKEDMVIDGDIYNYTITVRVKDGRYKYVVTNFYHNPEIVVYKGASTITNYGHCERMINPSRSEYGKMTQSAIVIGPYQRKLHETLSILETDIENLIWGLHLALSAATQISTADNW